MKRSTVNIQNESGEVLCVPLERFDEREIATVFIDGVPYHLERVSKDLLCKKYRVDSDLDYAPKTDSSNRCVMIAPFSQE